jgi:hypothetical protein
MLGENKRMLPEPVVTDIARAVCTNFLDQRRATRRHDLIVEYQITYPLAETESRELLKANEKRDEYPPSAGSSAVLLMKMNCNREPNGPLPQPCGCCGNSS